MSDPFAVGAAALGALVRAIGATWTPTITFKSPDGSPMDLTGATVTGAFYVMDGLVPLAVLTPTIATPTNSKAAFKITPDLTTQADASDPEFARIFPCRLVAQVVDSAGTVHIPPGAIVLYCPVDPRRATTLPPDDDDITAVIGEQGPAGASAYAIAYAQDPSVGTEQQFAANLAIYANGSAEIQAAQTDVTAKQGAAAQSAIAADGSRAQASGYATSAGNSAGAASGSANTAKQQAGIATEQAGIATDKAQVATDQAAISTTQAGNSAASAEAADGSRAATSALLLAFRSVFLGPFADDASASTYAAAQGVTVSAGLSYENTTTAIVRVWSGSAWADQDADAQTQSASAGASAGVATAQAGIATGAATTATTQAGISTVQAGISTAQANVATGAANQAQTLLASTSAVALQASGYVAAAAASAATAVAVTGLSTLSAAARAVALATDVSGVFVYDTTKDTDGGAWRNKVNQTSWMQEQLGTATRGNQALFPSRALLVTRAASLTIYNLDDPTCPMWRVFSGFTYTTGFNSPAALNGMLYLAFSSYVHRLDLISDTMDFAGNTNHFTVPGTIVTGNGATYTVSPGPALPSTAVAGLAATVVPLTPPDPLRCGLPNPTLAVGCSPLTIIKADQTVSAAANVYPMNYPSFDSKGRLWGLGTTLTTLYCFTPAQYLVTGFNITSAYVSSNWVDIGLGGHATTGLKATDDGCLIATNGGLIRVKWDGVNLAFSVKNSFAETGFMAGNTFASTNGTMRLALAESTATMGAGTLAASEAWDSNFLQYANVAALNAVWTGNVAGGGSLSGGVFTVPAGAYRSVPVTVVPGHTYAITLTFTGGAPASNRAGKTFAGADYGFLSGASGSVFYITPTQSPMWIGCWGGSSADTLYSDVSVVPVACDRAVNGYTHPSNTTSNVGVIGSVTLAPVATSAEMAAYGGFSAANYLETPYRSNLDFGTGDWLVEAWINPASAANSAILCYGTGTGSTAGWGLWLNASKQPVLDLGGTSYATSTSLPLNAWSHVAAGVRGGYAEVYVNGARVLRTATANSATLAGATLRIGDWANTSGLHTAATVNGYALRIALPRLTAYAPTPDLIAATYAAELPLMQPGAACLLLGSASCQQLALDLDTEQHAVATTLGTNVFRGFARTRYQQSSTVAGTAGNDNHKVVAMSGGDLLIGSAAGVDAFVSAAPGLRETGKRGGAPSRGVYDPTRGLYTGVTTGATATTIAAIPIPEGKAYDLLVQVTGMQYGGGFAERDKFVVEGDVYRALGGTAAVDATTRVIKQVTGTTAVTATVDTTNNLLLIQVTGKLSTSMQWVARADLTDVGLQMAA